MNAPFTPPHALLNLPPYPANSYAHLADRLKAALHTKADVIFIQAEAIVALEASAYSLGHEGMVALNIVTSPYGRYYGEWLRRAGATVHDLVAIEGRPIRASDVVQRLSALPKLDLVAAVHAETSTGIQNPLADIAEAARGRGALLVVDAVASVGGHELRVDELGIDVCVIGPQKTLGGPAGLSMASISAEAWQAMSKAAKPSPSVLNLLDLKASWLDKGRGAVPGMPSALEFWALEAAVQRIEDEGLGAVIARHALAAKATRAALKALGLQIWIGVEADASNLATAFEIPRGVDALAVIVRATDLGAAISPCHGMSNPQLLRADHTGARANPAAVLVNVMTLGAALRDFGATVDLAAATEAVTRTFAGAL
jgi:aspartate aminotransferase-like enzyme